MEQERAKIEETDYPEFDVKKMERFIKGICLQRYCMKD